MEHSIKGSIKVSEALIYHFEPGNPTIRKQRDVLLQIEAFVVRFPKWSSLRFGMSGWKLDVMIMLNCIVQEQGRPY
jgi:hypothetical protein